MPRANRHYLPGYMWHLTHRCHDRRFQLRFLRDRRAWIDWLYEARRRFGLCVLDYNVTSNHVHLLVRDQGRFEIAASMQLIAGQTAQRFNERKDIRGAFWEDRYHATAVDSDQHLARCMVYIDLNMVRAGVVKHPSEWETCGFHEIQEPPRRYRIIDREALAEALGLASSGELATMQRHWIEESLQGDRQRQPWWSEALAVGSREFVDRMHDELGVRARHRIIEAGTDGYVLRDPSASYRGQNPAENAALSIELGGL